jgi:hypothetical protein
LTRESKRPAIPTARVTVALEGDGDLERGVDSDKAVEVEDIDELSTLRRKFGDFAWGFGG